jgi:hypothetical protein
LSPLESAGDSKLREVIVTTPPAEIVKNDPSVPLFDHVTDSLAVNVWTEVEFSEIEIALVAPVADEGPVIVGAVESGFIHEGEVLEKLAPPTAVTVFCKVELSLSHPPASLVKWSKSLVFAAVVTGLLGTVNAEV